MVRLPRSTLRRCYSLRPQRPTAGQATPSRPCAFASLHPINKSNVDSWVRKIRDDHVRFTASITHEAAQEFGSVVVVHYSTPMSGDQHFCRELSGPDGNVVRHDLLVGIGQGEFLRRAILFQSLCVIAEFVECLAPV
jgi:hypothetical protein